MSFMGKSTGALVCAIALLGGVWPVHGAEQELTGAPAIRFALDKLNVLGSVLMIGAHPDDENTGVITYLARGRKIRTGYLSLTRGEGGQNLLGNEQSEYLGALRTQELLAARRLDGASQYFTRAIDFGFTKTASETLAKWGHDKVLSDIVWVVRQQQPDVIILCFSGTPADGHGQHQVSAILGREAFDAAADPTKFPEQLKWVKPWQAKRIMQARFTPPGGVPGGPPGANGASGATGALNGAGSVPTAATSTTGPPQAGDGAQAGAGGGRGGPGGPGAPGNQAGPGGRGGGGGRGGNGPVEGAINLPIGDYDPVLGRSYREISVASRSQHKSQAMVSAMSFGAQNNAMFVTGGAAAKDDLMEGVDTTWNRLPGGARIGELLARAQRDFDDLHPDKTVSVLLEARSLALELARSGQLWAEWKLDEIDHAIALCAGLRVEAQAGTFAYAPGATADLRLTAINRSKLPLTLTGIHVAGWGDADADAKNKPLAYNVEEMVNLKLTVPKDRPYSQPFWLRDPRDGDTYQINDQALIGRADTVPEVMVRFDLTVDGRPFSIVEPLHYRYADPSRDEFVRPVVVEPPVSVILPSQNFVIGIGTVRDISVLVRAMVPGQSGDLTFEIPPGWKVEPAKAAFDLKESGATQEVKFRLTPPASSGTGDFKVVARTQGGPQVATAVNVIDYGHIPAQTIFETSGGKIAAVQLKVLAKHVGYVMGSEDKMPEAIRQLGATVDLLDEKALTTGDLRAYDAIVTGLRAYAVRADLRAAQNRLLDYVNGGGTLVVQYNRLDDRRISPSVTEAFDHMGPYPFVLSQGNTQRVTEEDAPVRFLEPNSPVVRLPNVITQADFNGWIQERGTYFADTWDPKYQTPFETHDTGDKDLKGALLYTRYGKGAYIYTSFAWFREMPAGVPGAFRIFANLISAGKVAQ
jgi:LmbE family N-acetylglucosaminyl deacetylase